MSRGLRASDRISFVPSRRKIGSAYIWFSIPVTKLGRRPPCDDYSQRADALPLPFDDGEGILQSCILILLVIREAVKLLVDDTTDAFQPCSLEEGGRFEEGVDERGEREEKVDRKREG